MVDYKRFRHVGIPRTAQPGVPPPSAASNQRFSAATQGTTRPGTAADAVEQATRAIVAEQLGVSPSEIRLESSLFDDLGVDSLGAVEVVLALEEHFGIDISDEDTEHMRTFGDVVSYLKRRGVRG
jgi:acyl carrier protein